MLEPPKAKEQPAGSTFSLAVDGVRTGRTILPVTVQSDFAAYTLEFFAEGTTTNPVVSENRTNANLDEPVFLEPGTYDLYVTAYMDAGKTKPAAHGNLTGITISAAAAATGSVTLTAIIEEGAGTFSWDIAYPAGVTAANMTITPFDTAAGTAEQTRSLLNTGKAGSVTLNAGYYRVVFKLRDSGGQNTEHREYLHIYKNMDSAFAHTFEASHFVSFIMVTSGANTGAGSLRQAITDIPAGGTIRVDHSVGTIALTARLQINKSLTIEGNGVTITRDPSWTTVNSDTQLLYIFNNSGVNISRVHFKGGRASAYGGGIQNYGSFSGNPELTLESCIFSDNMGTSTAGGNSSSGAIYNTGAILIVKGCTFYNNKNESIGGAITNNAGNSSGRVTLVGNLFYGNTAAVNFPVVNNSNVTSLGYNVVDVTLGTGNTESGFAAAGNGTDMGDVNELPVSPLSFRLLSGSGAAGVIDSLPVDYPAFDFYGNPINASSSEPAASGAVQAAVSGTGFYLEVSVNNSAAGSVSVSPQPDDDGFVPAGAVTVTAAPNVNASLAYWLVNGVREEPTSANTLAFTITDHTFVQAVFIQIFEVTDFTDSASGNGGEGTLRFALNNAGNGDIIRFTGVTAGTSAVQPVRALPTIANSITIEGNGITITPTSGVNTQLLRIDGSTTTVNVSRVHFKSGRNPGDGGAIWNNRGNLTLKSCIFSDNQGNYGGAICNEGQMTVKGCTFYGNKARGPGGAIYNNTNCTLNLTGNLFYGNTGSGNTTGIVTSLGYNVFDAALTDRGTVSGFTAAADGTDTGNVSSLPISPLSFRFLSGSGAAEVITSLPAVYPEIDFYGNAISAGSSEPAAAGAVQAAASAGYYLEVSVSNSARGSVNVLPQPDGDGIVPAGAVTITAAPNGNASLLYWLVDGVREEPTSANTLAFTIAAHTTVQAIFQQIFDVTVFTDSASGDGETGTLRLALNNAGDGDVIRFTGVTAGTSAVQLARALPTITASITIEGNGVTITPTSGVNIQLLTINGSTTTVNVSRVHFKGGRADASVAYGNGGAINNQGNLTLESCIFSDNRAASSGDGGAVYTTGLLNIKGCTFYTNYAREGGAVGRGSGGSSTLVGNLFFENTVSDRYPVIYYVISQGYNVVDVALGTGDTQSGFNNANDKTLATLLGNNTTSPFVNAAAGNFAPVSGIKGVMPAAAIDGFPATDFFGNDRDWPGAPGAIK